jgi:hypothetical protein
LLTVIGLVQATNMFRWPGPLPDEGGYVSYAWAVGQRGVLSNYTYTYGHPPLAWLLITLWTWARGLFGHASYSIDVARQVMCVVTIVSCSLLFILARRLGMSRPFAAGAVILFALSPLGLYFHRAVLLDNVATAWAIGAFALALSPRRSLWSFAGSGACFAGCVLSKETTLVMLPAILLAAFYNTDKRTRRYCLGLLASFFLLVGLAFPLYAILKGELLPGPGHVSLVGTEINQLFTRQASGSIFDPKSVAHGTVKFWLSLDPWLLRAALLFSPLALALRTTRAIALCFLTQVAVIVRPGYLPYMYVIALLPFAALIVAGSLQVFWRIGTSNHSVRQVAAGQAWRRAFAARAATRLVQAAEVGSLVTITAAAAVAVVGVAPRWASQDHSAMTVAQDGPEIAAQHWLIRHVGHGQRLVVSDAFWIYLIENGFDSHAVKGGFYSRTVVSYWPFDKDPAVRRYFPYSWREFDYIVATPDMRVTRGDTPETSQALQHSRLVVGYGQGNQRIEIRAITPTPLGTGTARNTHRYTVSRSGTTPSLNQVAHLLGVSAGNLATYTNQHKDAPAWWYYEGRHEYNARLPNGVRLYYLKG